MNKYEYRKVLFGPNYSNSECIFSTKNKFLHSRILNQLWNLSLSVHANQMLTTGKSKASTLYLYVLISFHPLSRPPFFYQVSIATAKTIHGKKGCIYFTKPFNALFRDKVEFLDQILIIDISTN